LALAYLQTLNKFGWTLNFSLLSENVRSAIKINLLCRLCLFSIHLHLVRRLRMSGAELLHLYAFMVGKGKKMYLTLWERIRQVFLMTWLFMLSHLNWCMLSAQSDNSVWSVSFWELAFCSVLFHYYHSFVVT